MIAARRHRLPAVAIIAPPALLAAAAAWHGGGSRMLGLLAVGTVAGATLHATAFGFTGAWRRLVRERDGRGVRAQLLMLGLTAVVFFPLLAQGEALGRQLIGAVAPLGLSVAIGAFLFGIGMRLAGGCASGTLYAVGGGSGRMLLTLLAFIGGSVLGAAHQTFWAALPALPPTSLLTLLGAGPGLAIQLTVIGVLALASLSFERRRPVDGAATPRSAFMPAPLLVGAVLLALVNIATLLLAGHPWAVTFAFGLWGSKALASVGLPVGDWPYWQQLPGKLAAPVWSDVTSVMNLGIVVGAAAAALAADRFTPTLRIDRRAACMAVAGGLLLGYGARLAYGCNIGAFFSGVASGSLHGWLWLACASAGFWLAERMTPDPWARRGHAAPSGSEHDRRATPTTER